MAVKAKRFRIGVEGATTDGRTIERAWLEQMAASYNPQVYTALINLEHIKGYTPDSPFRRFGTVDKLEAEEIADGPLKGKMALYAWITPSADLVAYTRKLQKLFTSMEVNTSFADTGKAYLVGWQRLTTRQARVQKCCSLAPAPKATRWQDASRARKTSLPPQKRR